MRETTPGEFRNFGLETGSIDELTPNEYGREARVPGATLGGDGSTAAGPTSIGKSTRIEDSTPIVETGTTTVAVAAADGVVLAADARASLGGRFVTNDRARKVEPIDGRTALTFSGSVSDAQSFVRALRAEARLYEMRHGGPMPVETMATLAGGLVRRGPYRVLDLLLGGVDDDPAVYDVGPGGGVMRTEYAAGGSGMQLAYGALEGAIGAAGSTDGEAPSIAEARSIAVRAVRSATERDTASGDGLTVATIDADGVSLDRYDDLAEETMAQAAEGRSIDGANDEAGVN